MASAQESAYEADVRLALEAQERRRSGKIHTKKSDIKWEITKQGKIAYLADPHILGSAAQTICMFVAEMPPGGYSGMHRHLNEAVVYILSGHGYSTFDGVRYDWEEGEAICVPAMAWHQHFNLDNEKPARYLGAVNNPLMRSLGLMVLEQKEGVYASVYNERMRERTT